MFWLSLRSAAQYRTHTGQQFGKRERLEQIIVRAQLQSFHTVTHTVARCKKENRGANSIAPEFHDHFPAILMWEHDIHDKKIKFGRARLLQGAFTIARKIDCETGFAESFGQERRRFLFVLDNENPHSGSGPS